MTPDQLTALAARLRDHASDYITHPDDACKHSDLLAAAEYLRQCAQAEPVATVRVHNTGGNAGIAWSGVPTEHAGTMRGGTPLYTHPQPQQADVEDDSRWLGPFTTATEALNELRIAVATMMGADPNTWPDHGNAPLAIAAAFGIRQHAMELQSSAQADAVEALRDLLPLAEAFTRKAVFTAQRAGELASILDRARAVLAAQGGKDAE